MKPRCSSFVDKVSPQDVARTVRWVLLAIPLASTMIFAVLGLVFLWLDAIS